MFSNSRPANRLFAFKSNMNRIGHYD